MVKPSSALVFAAEKPGFFPETSLIFCGWTEDSAPVPGTDFGGRLSGTWKVSGDFGRQNGGVQPFHYTGWVILQ